MFGIAAAACVSPQTPPVDAYGVPSSHEGYVPARIAVLPCMAWPVRIGSPSASSVS